MNQDQATMNGYRKILVATDFSAHADAALSQGAWLGQRTGASVTLAHALPNLRKLLESASYEGKVDFLYGEGSTFHREVEQASEARMREEIARLNLPSERIQTVTLLGAPHQQITSVVQNDGYDLVVAGSRGKSSWQQLLVGSTAKRLVRSCPASTWIVKGENQTPPKSILVATDFSVVSQKAAREALFLADQADAEFHLIHVIDSLDATEEVLSRLPPGSNLRTEVNQEAKRRFDEFVQSLKITSRSVQQHLSIGNAGQEVGRLSQQIGADLIALGTIGRSGISELLLGNTAEKILDTCNCSILAVKPDNFVSPVIPPFKSSAEVAASGQK